MAKKDKKKMSFKEVLHYLNVMRDNSTIMQPEIRETLSRAIELVESYLETFQR